MSIRLINRKERQRKNRKHTPTHRNKERGEVMGEILKPEIKTLPLLPLKNSVLFPGMFMPLTVGRPGSIAAVEAAFETEDKEVVVVAQRDPEHETPNAADLFTIGTRAAIRKVSRSKGDHIEVMVI